MTDAYIIEHAGQTAGIVVAERGGVRFYASDRLYAGLDGQRYRSVRAARKAVIEAQGRAKSAFRAWLDAGAPNGAEAARRSDAAHRAAA